jgi:hypothetical protein
LNIPLSFFRDRLLNLKGTVSRDWIEPHIVLMDRP